MSRELNHRIALEKTARIFSQQFDINVVIGGDSSHTDGRRIVLHDQPSVLSKHPMEVQKDLLWHELGHVNHTDFTVPKGGIKPDNLMYHLHNMTEDGFVERTLSDMYTGIDFTQLHHWGFDYNKKKGNMRDPKTHLFLAIYSLLCDQKDVAMQHLDPDLVMWAEETFKDQIAQLDPEVCTGTAHTLRVAEEIRDILKEKGKLEEQNELQLSRTAPQNDGKGQDDQKDESPDQKETGKEEEGCPPDQGGEEEEGQEKAGPEDLTGSEEEDQTDANQDTSDDAESDDAGSSDDSEQEGDGGKAPQDDSPEESADDGDSGDGQESSGDVGDEPESSQNGAEQESQEPQQIMLDPKVEQALRAALAEMTEEDLKLIVEVEVTKMVDALMDQGGEAQKVCSPPNLTEKTPVDVAHMINTIRTQDKYIASELSRPSAYTSRWNGIRADVTKVIQLVQRMTLAQTKSRMSGCTDVGRKINTRYLSKLKTERRPLLYQERVMGKATDSAWLVLVDQTVSMRGTKHKNAIDMLIAWGEMLSALKQPFAAWGFGHVGTHDANIAKKIEQGAQYTRSYALDFTVFKEFEQSWASRKTAALKVQCSAGQTPTHWAMLEALLALVDRPEPRKVLTVVTDGRPNGDHKEPWSNFPTACCKAVVKLAERMGIDVVVVEVASVQVNWGVPKDQKIHVPDVTELASKMTEFTAKFWKGRILQDTGVWVGLKV